MVQMEWPLASSQGRDAKAHRRNLGDHALGVHALEAISLRLSKHAPRLFTQEAEPKVDFLDLEDGAGGNYT